MNWLKKCVVALICLLPLSSQAAKVEIVEVKSASMNKKVEVLVVCPDVADTKDCPVVFLLHGQGGNARQWITFKPELPRLADEKGIYFVCPDGKNSWYWDSPTNPEYRYETFVSSELIQYVDEHYNTIADRTGRAITGLSMGGHGAMWNGLRHSDVFSAVGATAGGVDIRPFPKNWNMKDQLGTIEQNPENWEKFTVINLVPNLQKGQIAIIVDCGKDDFFFEVNKNFHEALDKQGIEHDYIVRPGKHNRDYWYDSIEYQVLYFHKHFKKVNTKK